MLRAVGAGCKSTRTLTQTSPWHRTHISFFWSLRYHQRKPNHSVLATHLQSESSTRNLEARTFSISPDFHGAGGAGDPFGRHGFPAAGATRSAARPLAFRL